MNDEKFDDLLRSWADTKIPETERRENLILNLLNSNDLAPAEQPLAASPADAGLGRFFRKPLFWIPPVVAVLLLVLLFLFPKSPHESPHAPKFVQHVEEDTTRQGGMLRISLLVLRHEPDSETGVEFLEDVILTAENESLQEISLDGHKLFLWVFALEPALFSFDVGIDDMAETGILAAPEKTKAVHLRSGNREFDVFVSVL